MRRIASVLVVGCLVTPAPAQAESPLCLAALIDRSGSYRGIELARRMAGATVAQLEGGDSVLVRWISAESFHPKEVVVDRTLPGTPVLANQFSRHERRRARVAATAVEQAKRDVLLVLERTPLEPSGYTDLWGALRAAQEWRDALGCQRTTFIVISDLVHNRGKAPELRLEGVEIIVAGFEHGADVAETEEIRRRFRERVEAAGAQVRFSPPSRVPELRNGGAR